MAFRPLNTRHAIEEVGFRIDLAENLGAVELEAIAKAGSELNSDFPRIERPHVLELHVSDVPNPTPDPARPVCFKRFRADGGIDWQIDVDIRSISIACAAYTRWEDVWKRAQRYFQVVYEIGQIRSGAAGVSLRYVDTFVADDFDADVGEVIRSDTPYVPAHVLEHGYLWHSHQGWFEAMEHEELVKRVLNICEVSTHALTGNDGKALYGIRIVNLIRFEPKKTFPLRGAEWLEGNDSRLSAWMEHAHALNKEACRKILTDSMRERISLDAS